MKDSLLVHKSKQLALRIIRMYTFLKEEKFEYVMSKQVLRSGTSIGANLAESIYAQSDADYINKLSIARKEGSETLYWLDLLFESEIIEENSYLSIKTDCEEMMKLLTSTIKSVIKKNSTN